MRTSNIKENKQKRVKKSGRIGKNPGGGKKSIGAELKSEIFLNVSFDRLNRCKSRIQSVPSELSDIMSESLHCGVEVYNQAHLLHKAGQFSRSASNAQAVSQFCVLLNNLADENTENVLKLALPPHMKVEKMEPVTTKNKLHPALKMLDSFIGKRMTRASKFYKNRMNGYHEIIHELSKHLKKIENYH